MSVPGMGLNPTLTTGYDLTQSTTCTRAAASGTAVQLAPDASCLYSIDFIPVAAGLDNGTLTFTDNALNVAQATQSVSLVGTGTVPDATSMALSVSLATVSYNGATTLTAAVTDSTNSGTTPAGTVNFTDTFNGVTASISSAVNFTGDQATTSYFATQVGLHTIHATYVPTANFDASSKSAVLAVTKANPTIAWAEPEPIDQGTSLAGVLNALAQGVQQDRVPAAVLGDGRHREEQSSLSGTYAYTATPGGGSASAVTTATILAFGAYRLDVAFTPADTAHYTTATATVNLLVLPLPQSFGSVAVGSVSRVATIVVPFLSARPWERPAFRSLLKGQPAWISQTPAPEPVSPAAALPLSPAAPWTSPFPRGIPATGSKRCL